MQLLIVAATHAEIKSILEKRILLSNIQVDTLITGVGMIATTFQLTKILAEKNYDLVINIGIAGSFDRAIVIGEVVEIISDHFSELGAEDGDRFISGFEIGLIKKDEKPFVDGLLIANHDVNFGLKKVRGITVNKVHGNQQTIDFVKMEFNPDVESMEGAAVFYVCNMLNVKCCQIRSISNYVEPRKKNNWDISLAVNNLNIKLEEIIKQFA